MDLVEYRRLTVCKSYVNDLSNVFCTYAPVFCKFSVLFYKVWLNVFREIRDIIWEDPFLYEQDPYRAYCIEVGCYTLCFLCVYCHFYETFRGVPRPPSSLKVLVASVCVLVVAIAHLVHEGRTEYFASENLLSPIIIAIKDWIYISMNLLIPWVIMAAKWVYLVLEDQVMSDPLVITTIEWVSLVSEGVDLDKLLHKAVIVVVLLWIYKRRNWQERQDCCKAILILLLVDRVMRLAIKVMARALRELTVVDVIQSPYPTIVHIDGPVPENSSIILRISPIQLYGNGRAIIQISSNRLSNSAAIGDGYIQVREIGQSLV